LFGHWGSLDDFHHQVTRHKAFIRQDLQDKQDWQENQISKCKDQNDKVKIKMAEALIQPIRVQPHGEHIIHLVPIQQPELGGYHAPEKKRS
jgi:hypothetical protein